MQELASCVCNYAQVRGCRAVCLGQGFEARKEGREEVGGEGWGGGDQESENRKRTKEAVKLEKKSGYFTHGCFVNRRCVCWGRGGRRWGGSAGKGCVYPICSLPLPCGRKNHWLTLIPEDTEAETDRQREK